MFFENSSFINISYALDIALEHHFANMLLKGDLSKIVYASTDYALRKRSNKENWNSDFMPFMNYKMNSITQGEGRPVWNSTAKLKGVYDSTLKKYIKYTPVKISYDATVWYHDHFDNLFAMSEGIWDDSSETIITYTVQIPDYNQVYHDLNIYGVLGYDLDFDPQYNQNDWLKENKIHTTTLNFSIETLLIKSEEDAWLPDEVIFNFAYSKGLNPADYDDVISIMYDYTGLR